MNNMNQAIELKLWLIKNSYSQTKIAKDLKISRQTVWKTIHGRDRNRRVEQWLKDNGCQVELT